MLTNEQLSGLFSSSDLAGQIQGAVARVALEIRDESGETPNHANRIAWARRVLASPATGASQVRAAVLTDYSDVLAAPYTLTDAQIEASIRSSVNTFADGT